MGEAQIVVAAWPPRVDHPELRRDLRTRAAGHPVHLNGSVGVCDQPRRRNPPRSRVGAFSQSGHSSLHPHCSRVGSAPRLPHQLLLPAVRRGLEGVGLQHEPDQRLGQASFDVDSEPCRHAQKQCLLRYMKAYSFCLKHHLTNEAGGSLRDELAEFLEPEEAECMMSSQNRPIYVLQVISAIVNQCQISHWEKVTMDKNLTWFHDNVGACERIFKTPIPVAYTRLTSRVLTLWHIALPFALWEVCGWLTIPVTSMSSAALFYIEEVGVLIEEPFWILALSSTSTGIVLSLDALAAAHKEALMITWTRAVSLPNDHVVLNFDRSRSDLCHYGVMNIVLSRMKSVW